MARKQINKRNLRNKKTNKQNKGVNNEGPEQGDLRTLLHNIVRFIAKIIFVKVM